MAIVCVALVGASGTAAATPTAGTSGPWVSSDRADYAPGATVTLSGSAWTPGDTVHIVVDDSTGHTWKHTADVTVDQTGAVQDQFSLPTSFVAQYSVTSDDTTNGVDSATTSFTDGTLTYSPTRFPSSGSLTVITSNGPPLVPVFVSPVGGGPAPVATGVTTTGTGTFCSPAGTQIPASWLQVAMPLPQTISGPTLVNVAIQAPPGTNGIYSGQVVFTTQAGSGGGGAGFSLCLDVVSDVTPPVITHQITGTLGNSGWYTSNVSVSFSVSDPESTVTSQSAACSGVSVTNDQAATTYTCQATSTGGPSSDSVTINRDATAPSVSITPSRAPDGNGWYNHPVSFSASATDNLSGGVACDPDTSYSGADDGSASVQMSCTDAAGNTGSASRGFQYDATAPSVTVTPSRGPDHNGWYNDAVSFSASASNNGPSGAGICDPTTSYSAPDTGTASVEMSCTDGAGNTASNSASFKYDSTAPTNVATTLDRVADHNGWYNHAVGWSTNATDATSGIDASTCSSGTYGGEDGSPLSVSGTCTDNAGNPSASDTATFEYDTTAPTLRPSVSPNPVVLNGSATASANASDNLSAIDATNTSCGAVNTGSVGAHSVSCTATDNAGNTAGASASYSVNYKWTGFLAPLSPDQSGTVMNVGAAGKTYPIKWQLQDAGGGYIGIAVSGTTIAVAKIACTNVSGDPTDTIDYASSTGGTALRYDSTANQYIYNWQTLTTKAACYRMTVTVPDGTQHLAVFQMK